MKLNCMSKKKIMNQTNNKQDKQKTKQKQKQNKLWTKQTITDNAMKFYSEINRSHLNIHILDFIESILSITTVFKYSIDHVTLQPDLSVRRSIVLSNFFYFFGTYGRLWHYYSCLNAWFAFIIIVPAHQHATSVTVYPALFSTCQ